MGKIDPGFVASPYYGDSNYDPVAAVKQIRLESQAYDQALAAKKVKDIEKGLSQFDLEIKDWADSKGFDEIHKDLSTLQQKYIDVSSQNNVNLLTPRTAIESKLSKAFTSEMDKIKQKNAIWQQSKVDIDSMNKLLADQRAKPEEDRDVDIEATYKNIQDWKKKEGKIADKAEDIPTLVVGKARPVDIGKFFQDKLKYYIPGVDKKEIGVYTDPATGKTTTTTWEGVDPKRIDDGINKTAASIKNAPSNIQNAIEKAYQQDNEKGVLSKEEWIKQTYLPSYQSSKTSKTTGGTSSGLSIAFMGKQAKIQPGRVQNTPYNYGTGEDGRTYQGVVEYNTKDSFIVPVGGEGSSYFIGNKWMPLAGGSNFEGQLLFYDPTSDSFMFRTSSSEISPMIPNNINVSVPRSILGDRADNLPIKEGTEMKLFKDVYGTTNSGPKLIGGKSFIETNEPGGSNSSIKEQSGSNKKKVIGGKDYSNGL
jgi:hypothetical protein